MEQKVNKPKIALFGTPDYSLLVFNKLHESGYPIVCVITKPPRPVGRERTLIPTPVAEWASSHQLPLLTPLPHPDKPWHFQDESRLTQNILRFHPDILITADYTQKIPLPLLSQIKYGGLNVHPSLLPAYRGPAPVPWAILSGETETGVSIVTLTEKFDQGHIIAQKKEPILPTDTTDSLLSKLFIKGASLLTSVLPAYITRFPNYELRTANNEIKPSYFPRLNRESGFEPWDKIKKATETGEEAERIERKWRALHPWPGLWTKIQVTDHRLQTTVEKRLKILKLHLQPETGNLKPLVVFDQIQLEGKRLVSGRDTAELIRQASE